MVGADIYVMVFVRFKPNTHCEKTWLKSKRHEVVWCANGSALTITTKMLYDCDRNWLINHPFLSCFTEIQLIKPKR